MILKNFINIIKVLIFFILIFIDRKNRFFPLHSYYLEYKILMLSIYKGKNENLTKERNFLDKSLNIPKNNNY